MANAYTAGAVTAKIQLDTKNFTTAIDDLKAKVTVLKNQLSEVGSFNDVSKKVKELDEQLSKSKNVIADLTKKVEEYQGEMKSLQKENQELNKTITKMNETLKANQSTLDNTVKSHKSNTNAIKSETKETAKLNREVSKMKSSKKVMGYDYSNKELQTASNALSTFANLENKTSEVVAKSTKKNIESKAKEAQAFKKYNLEEIHLMQRLNDAYNWQKQDGGFGLSPNLYPIDYKNAHENYSSILRRNKRKWQYSLGDGGINVGYEYDNYTKRFQKRMKEILGDLGVTISSKSDGEFKRIRDAFNGKMMEYLDLSGFKDNSQWLKKVEKQIIDFEAFKNKTGRFVNKKDMNWYDMEQLKEGMDRWKKANFEEFGKEGNPFIKDYLKNVNDGIKLMERYKQAQRGLFDNKNNPFAENRSQLIEKAGTALNTFNRMLNTTEVNFNKLAVEVKRDSLEIENAIRKFASVDYHSPKQQMQDYLRTWSEASITVKRDSVEIENAIAKFAPKQKNIKEIKELKQALKELGETKIHWRGAEGFTKAWENTKYTFKKDSEEIRIALNKTFQMDTFDRVQSRFNSFCTGFNKLTGEIIKTTDVLNKFNFKLLEGVERETIFYQRTVQLASAIHKMNAQGTANWSGRQTVGGYSNYLSSITRVNQALEKQASLEAKLKAQRLDQYYAKVNAATHKYWSQIREGTITLNTYKSNISQITKQLDQQIARTQRLATAQYTLFHKYHTTNLNTYKANMNEINAALEKQTAEANKSSTATKKAGASMTQTAHSGRILSNTLYQIRGALLSLKMIFTAMGGMALWGFASDLAEGVQETFRAKNEMEAVLRQNSKVSNNGIAFFNKQLDAMTKKFKKINKYSIGETVASIGLEFDLNAQQMADSLDVVSMIQSEYVRAGRKEEEAALAVKDILQGEFQRLSRETGVGKEELQAYGWNGDKTDVESLMDALRKAALDRHWDLFAAKATSLNDVLTMTKSRFSELGADLMQSSTPMIVGAFNSLIDAFEGLSSWFGKLGSFWQQFTLIGGGVGVFGGLLTALPMVTKQMGLLEIATIGWDKSILTALLNLNKMEVAQYGFRKALAATISGTKASELANTRWTKSIIGRVLGLNQSTLAEKGYLTAMVQSKAVMKGTNETLAKLSANTMSRSQKLAYLTTNIDLNTASTLHQGEAIKKVATSWRIWRAAILGVVGIAVVAWLASVSAQCKQTKKDIDGFHKVVENGDTLLEKAKKKSEDYGKSLETLAKGSDAYKRADANKERIDGQIRSLNKAVPLAKKYDYQIKQYGKSISDRKNDRLVQSLQAAGLNYAKATEKAIDYEKAVQDGYNAEIKAYQIEDDRLYKASQHINERIGLMKEEGIAQKDRIKYAQEYQEQADKTAEHWKEFAKGNFNAGIYAVMDELTLVWIDIWNNTAFLNFWRSVEKTWSEIVPMANGLKDALIGVGEALANFYGTELGRNVINVIAFGTAIGLVSKKIAGWLGYSKSTVEALKTVGGKLKDAIKKWRGYKDAVDEAKKSEMPTTTKSETPTTTPDGKPISFKETLKNDAKNYARAAIGIAAGMALITEAIYLLKAPMWALSEVGKQFKADEPQIREGIEGLQLIAPTVIAIMVPAIALCYCLEKYVSTEQLLKGALKAVIGIAVGIGLVTEAIFLLNAPILSLALLGGVYGRLQESVNTGITAMRTVNDALLALVPWIPVFIGGIVLAAAASTGIGAIGLVEVAMGIALGISLVTEAIYLLNMPLIAIASLGNTYQNLDGVKEGAEAIKITAEALKYVSEAMASLTLIDFNLFAQTVTDLVSKFLGVDLGSKLNDLTGEDGVLKQLSDFTKAFNSADFQIEEIDPAKVETLANAGNGFKTISDAMEAVKTAMDSLPDEFKNGSGTPALTYNAETDKTSINTGDVTGYFDSFKEPIKQLSTFVTDFNNSEELNVPPIDSAKVEAINTTANGISSINSAIQNVKTAVGSTVDAQWAGNMASGGIVGATIGYLFGDGNPQASGLKSGLDELYLSVKDIMDFNTKINGLTSEGSGDTSNIQNASNIVSALQTEINNLKSTLTSAVPTVKTAANGMGKAIVTGFQSGMSNLSSTVNSTLDGVSSTFTTKGNAWGDNLTNGFKDHFKIKDIATTEVGNTLDALSGKDQEFYDKGYALGDAFQRGYKDGGGINSPGYAAMAMKGELGYMTQYINDAMGSMPQLAGQLAQNISTMLSPSFDLSNLQFPDISQWTTNLTSLIPTVTNVKSQVSTSFTNMSTTVGQSLTGIANNAKSKYSSILSTTRTSLSGMQSATTKNIGQIRSSWKGMQDALIASAEHIRSQTGSKIDALKKNMGDFWNKIKHPDQLVAGAAGGRDIAQHTIRRRSSPRIPSAGSNDSLFKTKRSKIPLGTNSGLLEYIKCLLETGEPCFAGGWNFNWTPSITGKFKGWNTHFNKYSLDDFLNVGKFENDNFPVKGNAKLAKAYISDVITSTEYDFYFNERYDPATALRRGMFNCVDGARVAIALASAFGFGGGSINYGSWGGTGHGWANIPSLGIIDATALQKGYGFKSPKVRGYSAGTIKRSHPTTTENNNNTKNVTYKSEVHVHGNIYGVEDLQREMDKACERNNKKLFTNSLSGV